ncbi:hypothetical protein GCM10027417_04920 [Glutamicibacter endophyticus]
MGLLVSVQSNEMQVGETGKQSLGMTAHTQGAVNDHGLTPLSLCVVNSRRKQIHATIQKYRNMPFRRWSLILRCCH